MIIMNRKKILINKRFRILEFSTDQLISKLAKLKSKNNPPDEFFDLESNHTCDEKCGHRSFFVGALQVASEFYNSFIKMSKNYNINEDPLHMEFEFALIETLEEQKEQIINQSPENQRFIDGVKSAFEKTRALVQDTSDEIKKLSHQYGASMPDE